MRHCLAVMMWLGGLKVNEGLHAEAFQGTTGGFRGVVGTDITEVQGWGDARRVASYGVQDNLSRKW